VCQLSAKIKKREMIARDQSQTGTVPEDVKAQWTLLPGLQA
jgi:hypothetical protein